MSFELIAAEEAHYPKALMCRALGLSRSGHHSFRTRGSSRHDLEQQKLDLLVVATFTEFRAKYGAPRIEHQLRRRGHRTSRKRVAASMLRQGLVSRPKQRWRATTDSGHCDPIAPNLLQRHFSAPAPNRIWVADTTYLPVIGGFLFLVAIIDLFSRKVVGWSLGDRLDADLSAEALRRALAKRQPAAGLIFHSDRGVEFAANNIRQLLVEAQAVQSMSRKGNCWDNAVAESFFSTLEFEGPSPATWRYPSDAEPEIFTFIERYYNQTRLHSYNSYIPPNEVEAALRNGALAA
jgi:transposase InsO family protein